jgi:hypothetical protein
LSNGPSKRQAAKVAMDWRRNEQRKPGYTAWPGREAIPLPQGAKNGRRVVNLGYYMNADAFVLVVSLSVGIDGDVLVLKDRRMKPVNWPSNARVVTLEGRE